MRTLLLEPQQRSNCTFVELKQFMRREQNYVNARRVIFER
jgi:hypothetical protein